jgi:hypothetical protein
VQIKDCTSLVGIICYGIYNKLNTTMWLVFFESITSEEKLKIVWVLIFMCILDMIIRLSLGDKLFKYAHFDTYMSYVTVLALQYM